MSFFLKKISFTGKRVFCLSDDDYAVATYLDRAGATFLRQVMYNPMSDNKCSIVKSNDRAIITMVSDMGAVIDAATTPYAWDVVIVVGFDRFPKEPLRSFLQKISARAHAATLFAVDTPTSLLEDLGFKPTPDGNFFFFNIASFLSKILFTGKKVFCLSTVNPLLKMFLDISGANNVLHVEGDIFEDIASFATEQPAWDIVVLVEFHKFNQLMLLDLLRNIFVHSHENTLLCVDSVLCSPSDSSIDLSQNTYTTVSLKKFLEQCGFYAITEGHFFSTRRAINESFPVALPFKERWDAAKERGVAVTGGYEPDKLANFSQLLAEQVQFCLYGNEFQGIVLSMAQNYYMMTLVSSAEWDTDFVNHMKPLLSDETKIIFDVGGFIGLSSLSFSRILPQEGRVICIEPNPWNVDKICEHFSFYPVESKKLSLYPIAMGESNEVISMYMSDNTNLSAGSQRIDGYGTIETKDHLRDLGFLDVEVNSYTLDFFIKTTNIIPDIIKVDIEGSEVMFLKGAKQTLINHSPLLYMELHTPQSSRQCLEILNSHRYRVELLRVEPQQGMLHIFAEKRL